MGQLGAKLDRVLGRVYTRFLAITLSTVAFVMLVSGVVSWRQSGGLGALIWLSGAMVFGFIARASWRSKAGLSDIDTT